MRNLTPTAGRLKAASSGPAAARPNFSGMAAWLSGRQLIVTAAALPLALVLLLLVVVLWSSLVPDITSSFTSSLTLSHYRALLEDPLVLSALENTAGFVAVSTLVAMGIGIAAAWLVERTDFPARRLVYSLMTSVLLLPSIFVAMGWTFLLHPRIGVLNTWLMRTLGLHDAPFNITNVVGMGWVEGLGLASLAFVMTSPIFRALSAALDEAATVHGISRARSFVLITLPLMAPALIAAAIYIAVIAIASFEIPAVIGLGSKVYTFSTLVYIKVVPEMGIPEYGVVGAVSVFLIILSVLLSWSYFRVIRLAHRYEVIRGRGYDVKRAALGWWRWAGYGLVVGYFIFACVVPLVMVAWVALLPYVQPFSAAALRQLSLRHFYALDWSLIWRSAAHTLVLMVAVPTISLVFGAAISWVVVKSKLRGRFLFDWVAFLPHAVPNLIFAIAMVIVALRLMPSAVPFYGTIYILMAVYVLVRISLVTRVCNGALLQVHGELDEAAHVSGLSTVMTIRKISVPLLLPALVNLWIWIALLTYRELTMAAFMVTHDNITLPVLVWSDWNGGNTGAAATVSLLFILMLLPLLALYWAFRGRSELVGPNT